jgi:uncharacterized LabA/DUF88 family protein
MMNQGPTVIPKRRYLFADGACLTFAMKAFGDRYFGCAIAPAPEKLISHLSGNFDKVFYYDALPIQEEDESDEAWRARTAEKRQLLECLENTDRFEVFEGDVRRKGGARDKSRGQKKVDVAIAVDMLTNAFRRNMDEATLLAGDLDFEPLLRGLAREGMPVTLIHPSNTTAELKRAALIRQRLDARTLWSLAPNEFLSSHPIVTAHYGLDLPLAGLVQLAGWVDEDGRENILSKRGDMYMFRRRRHGEQTLVVNDYPDKRVLALYCSDLFDVKWPTTVAIDIGL